MWACMNAPFYDGKKKGNCLNCFAVISNYL